MGCVQTFPEYETEGDHPGVVSCTETFIAHSPQAHCIQLHPEKPLIGAGLQDGRILAWNYESGELVVNEFVAEDPVRSIDFIVRKDFDWLIYGCDDCFCGLYDMHNHKTLFEFKAHTDLIRCIIVHPFLSFVLTGSDDEKIRLWSWPSWKPKGTFKSHTDYVMDLKFCRKDFSKINYRDKQRFASCSMDGTIKLWRINGELITTFGKMDRGFNSIDFHPDISKPHILAGNQNKTVTIWNFKTGQCLLTLEHPKPVQSVSYHLSLPYYFSSTGKTVNIWSDHDNDLLQELTREATKFTSDSRPLLAFCCSDGVVLVSFESIIRKRIVADLDSKQVTVSNHALNERFQSTAKKVNIQFIPGAPEDPGMNGILPRSYRDLSSDVVESSDQVEGHRKRNSRPEPLTDISDKQISFSVELVEPGAFIQPVDEHDEPEELSDYKFQGKRQEGEGEVSKPNVPGALKHKVEPNEYAKLVDKLQNLLESGTLTQNEFEIAKTKLLE